MSRFIAPCLVPLLGVLLLSACGGGAGGGSGGSSAGVGGTPSAKALGKRSLPGYLVEVTQQPSVASSTIAVRVLVTPDAGLPQPNSVACWIGGEYSESATMVSASLVPGSTDQYELSLTRPADPTGLAVWARLSFADGSVLEAGRETFALQ